MKKTLSRIVIAAAFACSAFAAQAATLIYDNYIDKVFAGTIIKTDPFKCLITTSAYTANKATHQWLSDVTNEVSGTGYTAGGISVTPTFVLDTTLHKYTITFPQVQWPSSTIVGRYQVCYKNTGTAASSPLIFMNDFGADVSTTNGTFTVNASTINLTPP